jgi:hypothetical protein
MTPYLIRSITVGSILISFGIAALGGQQNAQDSAADIVCSYAPSQSKAVIAVSGVAGGAAATTAGIGSVLGLTVVSHSSGYLILSGSSGYIAGTLGAAVVAPVLITVGAIVGGTAVTVEMFCSPRNHPDGYKKVVDAAQEFSHRTGDWVQRAKIDAMTKGAEVAKFSEVTLSTVNERAGSLYAKVFRK